MSGNSDVAVAVFNGKPETLEAVSNLRKSGFQEDDIVVGFVGEKQQEGLHSQGSSNDRNDLAAATVRARWGLSILAGAVTTLDGETDVTQSLRDFGLERDEITHYRDELRSGHILIAVLASGRQDVAESILSHAGGHHLLPHRS